MEQVKECICQEQQIKTLSDRLGTSSGAYSQRQKELQDTEQQLADLQRTAQPGDPDAVTKAEALVDRRNLLRGTVSLGALTFLTGCDVSDTSAVRSMLLARSHDTHRASADTIATNVARAATTPKAQPGSVLTSVGARLSVAAARRVDGRRGQLTGTWARAFAGVAMPSSDTPMP